MVYSGSGQRVHLGLEAARRFDFVEVVLDSGLEPALDPELAGLDFDVSSSEG